MRFLLVTLITLVLTIAFFMLIILPLLEEKVKPRPLPSKPYTKTTNPPATQPAPTQPKPTEDEIKEAISGNLCRCTGYVKIIEGIKLAAQRLKEQQ